MAARALLLDLDRTLVDLQTYTDYGAALADVEALMGTWDGVDVPETDWDHPTMACMSVLHSLIGDPRWNAMSEAIAAHERAAIPRSVVMPSVLDARDRLRSVPTAIVTLLAADVVVPVLAEHGIQVGPGAEINVVVGRDRDVRPKPEADGLLAACVALGVEPGEVVMIGDSTWDAEAASRAGIAFLGVPSGPGSLPDDAPSVACFADAVELALR